MPIDISDYIGAGEYTIHHFELNNRATDILYIDDDIETPGYVTVSIPDDHDFWRKQDFDEYTHNLAMSGSHANSISSTDKTWTFVEFHEDDFMKFKLKWM